jgi:N-acetylmuramoyl-L-alanine amidase
MEIIQDFIAHGMRHRPMTNPRSSLYKKTMVPKYITIHNAYSRASAASLHAYVKSQRAADRPASWHFSIDEKDCYQALPLNEVGWHAGDNLGPGNTTTIGIEICDYAMLLSPRDEKLYLQAEEHTAKLCAWLIRELPSLHPFPHCLKQHWNWSGKNCPSWIRARANGWEQFVSKVERYLTEGEPEQPQEITYYRVIAGSYMNLINAEEVKASLIQNGYRAFILPFYHNNQKYNRVVAGSYKDKNNAERTKQELITKGYRAFVLPFTRLE